MKIFKFFSEIFFKVEATYAHCDIPCGIYDPHAAQVAAHTVIRMVGLINDLKASSENATFEETKEIAHKISRFTQVKDEHAEIVKHEVRVLWGDYFKEEHLQEYPKLTETVFHTLKLASKARQEVNLETAKELLEYVQEMAEIFYKSKGLTPLKIKPPFPTEGEIVSFKA